MHYNELENKFGITKNEQLIPLACVFLFDKELITNILLYADFEKDSYKDISAVLMACQQLTDNHLIRMMPELNGVTFEMFVKYQSKICSQKMLEKYIDFAIANIAPEGIVRSDDQVWLKSVLTYKPELIKYINNPSEELVNMVRLLTI